MNDLDIRLTVLLGSRRALLGMVTSNLRAVTCAWDESLITMRFIFDGEPTEWQWELCQVATTEIIADFYTHHIRTDILSHSYPKKLDELFLQEWIYMRWEPGPDDPHSL